MIVGFVPDGVEPEQVRAFYRALQRAQHDIDLHHQRYAHFYLSEVPPEYHDQIEVAAFGPGERIVFEPYTAEMYQTTHKWVEERAIFEEKKVGRAGYDQAALTFA
jgi:hypothetical protein